MNPLLFLFIRGSALPSVGVTTENDTHGWQRRPTDLTEKPDERRFESIAYFQQVRALLDVCFPSNRLKKTPRDFQLIPF